MSAHIHEAVHVDKCRGDSCEPKELDGERSGSVMETLVVSRFVHLVT